MQTTPLKIESYIIHLRTLISGTKPSILLVHGLGVSGNYYIKYAEALAPYFNVYIVDLPGYGKTPKPKRPLTIVQLSKILTEYVATNGLNNCIVVGQSMGCQIVAHAIVDSPHYFQKAILLAPTTNKDERNVLIQGFRLWQDTFHESIGVNLIVLKNYIRMGLGRFLITSHYMIDDHIEDTLKKVTIPVLVVNGSKDKIAPKKWTEFLASITPLGKAVEIKSAPHLMQYQKPNELVQITREFTSL